MLSLIHILIVPFSLIKYYTGTEFFKSFYVQADKPEDVPMVTTQVEQVLLSRHRSGARYRVENLSGILETAHSISPVSYTHLDVYKRQI